MLIIIRLKLALPMLKKRPLALEFTSAVVESTNVVQPWIQAGLLEIGLVRRHENKKLLQHRKVAPKCRAPHWDGVACCEGHQGTDCPLERSSSGWRMLARMDSKPQQQEPEPEPEPELEPEPEPESAVKVHVPQSFVNMAVMWAAMDAGRDAVARLRKHEEENRRHAAVAEGVPPGGS